LRLKNHKATSQVALIAVSGYGQAQDRQRSMETGFAYHLVKPVDTGKLAFILSTINSI
jgi:CheY-like chemotaxis protein